MKKRRVDPATQYAKDVVQGKLVAGKLVRLACQRHLRDMETAHERGLWFDESEVYRVEEFFREFCRHSKGELAGQPVILAPWQVFRLGSIFGWKREDGWRRFRTAYNQVARKNGKSTEAAGVGLYGLIADNEAGAGVYSAATTREQARIVFEEADRMVKKSPELAAVLERFKSSLYFEQTESIFAPLAAEDSNLDGLNVHVAIIDELHAHKTSGVLDVLDSATGARKQPLIFIITTSGFEASSVCYNNYEYARKILEGVVEDDSFFAYIAQLDEEDHWDDSTMWIKANPNLGVSLTLESLLDRVAKARNIPSALTNFKVKCLNFWENATERWIPAELWAKNKGAINEEELLGNVCFGGLDLSENTDLSAFILVFPVAGRFKIISKFYLPEEGIDKRSRDEGIPFRHWANQGLLTLTPGDYVDFSWIKADILKAAETYDLQELAFDRYRASRLTQELAEEGITLLAHSQSFLGMHAPSTEFINLLGEGRIEHGGNEILKWMADNVTVIRDSSGNIKPNKDEKKSKKKIDGIVAAIMAVGRAIFAEDEDSVYDGRGFLEI